MGFLTLSSPYLSASIAISSLAYLTPRSLFTFTIIGVNANLARADSSVGKYFVSLNSSKSKARYKHRVFTLTFILAR